MIKLESTGLGIHLQLEPWKWDSKGAGDEGSLARWKYTVENQEGVLVEGRAFTYMDAVRQAEEAAARHARKATREHASGGIVPTEPVVV